MRRRQVDVLFDARHLSSSGIGTYTRTCLEALRVLQGEDGCQVGLIARSQDIDEIPEALRKHVYLSDAKMYSACEQMLWARRVGRDRPRLLWLPHYPVPLLARPRSLLVTVHDLLHAMPPHAGGPGGVRRIYANMMLRLLAARSEVVLTVSQSTCTQLEHEFARLRGRVRVTNSEVSPEWFSTTFGGAGEPCRKPYFIYVGNVRRHKDVGTLLKAYSSIQSEVPEGLLIVGGGTNPRDVDVAALEAADAEPRVQVRGTVPFDELRALVANATALVMPSLYEGLGLPALEAMAVGTPCVVADAAALLEGVGSAALIFRRSSVEQLAAQLLRVAGEPELRAKLRAEGRERVAGRSRARAVSELLQVLRDELRGR